MKILALILVILLSSVSIALIVLRDPGYILIAYGLWTVESTLALFALFVLLLLAVLYFSIYFIIHLWRFPSHLKTTVEQQKKQLARRKYIRGLMALAEGRWTESEKYLLSSVDNFEHPLLSYLSAAKAAQQQNNHEKRDQYLRQALKSMPAAEVAVGLTQAELQLEHQQLEQALATLMHLRSIAPRHTYVLKLLKELYSRLYDWQHLKDLLLTLVKQNIIEQEEAKQLEVIIYTQLLKQCIDCQQIDRLIKTWEEVPEYLQQQEHLLLTYTIQLHNCSYDHIAEPLIADYLQQQWSEKLVYVYGFLHGPDLAKQLTQAEEWLQNQPRNAILLLTLGRLCIQQNLLEKAHDYLEASIEALPRAEAYRELGNLLERLNQTELAMEYYRKGLLLATKEISLFDVENEKALIETPTIISNSRTKLELMYSR